MALSELLSGCCPFLKTNPNQDNDEPPLLNPDGSPNELGFDNEDQTQNNNNNQSSPNHRPDPNNNNKKLSTTDSDNDDFEDDETDDDDDEEEDDEDELQADCVKTLDNKLLYVRPGFQPSLNRDNFNEKKLVYQKQISGLKIKFEDLPALVVSKRKLLSPDVGSNSARFLGGPDFVANSSLSSFDIDPSVLMVLNSMRWIIWT